MKPKKVIKECEKILRKDPENLVVRLKLAAAYRERGRTEEAVELYRSVAVAYHSQGRLPQAIAVCKSVLEIEPAQSETQALLVELDRMRGVTSSSAPAPISLEDELPSIAPKPLPARTRPPQMTVRRPPTEGSPAGGAPIPQNPAVEQLPSSPVRSLATSAAAEWGKASGMTPHRDDYPSGLVSDPDGVLKVPSRNTERMSSPPERRSSGALRLTPTPLPEPLALHDAHDDSLVSALPFARGAMPGARSTLRGAGPAHPPALPPEDDDDLPTRIAPDVLEPESSHEDDLPTRIADAMPPSLGADPMVVAEHHIDPDEDALTMIADESGQLPIRRPAPGPALPTLASPAAVSPQRRGPSKRRQPSIFDRDTKRIIPDDAADLIGAEDDDDDDDLPTRNPARPGGLAPPMDIEIVDDLGNPEPTPLPRTFQMPDTDRRTTAPLPAQPGPTFASVARQSRPSGGFPTDIDAYKRGDRLLDGDTGVRGPSEYLDEQATDPSSLSDDEVTGSYDEEPTNPGRGSDTNLDEPAPRNTRRMPTDLELSQAFDRPFAETLERLDPAGSAIDTPLSIFSDLPDEALAEMARGMALRHYQAGEIVLREGDPGDACFVVANGAVRVLKRDPLKPRGELIEVARLGNGALFGEFALLADRRRHATVQAVAKSDIYEIPRRLLRELAATFPTVGPLLETFYRDRLLATLLLTAPFFKPLPSARRTELLARFAPRRAESGEHIVSEGKPAGGLFLIVLGSVEITKRVSDKRSVLLGTLGEGAYFGEMSLLRGSVASATVTAAGPTELAVMPPRDFYQVVAENPQLWNEVRREANRRQLETNQIVTGETNLV